MTTHKQNTDVEATLRLALEFVEGNHLGGPDAFELITAIKAALEAHKALAQQSNEQVPVAWEPLETAPKDGSMVLICLPRQMNLVVRGRFNRIHNFWQTDYEGEGGITKPTYFHEGDLWHPIPPLYTHPPVPYVVEPRTAQPKEPEHELERQIDQLIQERDHRDEIIDKLCDSVLGSDRYEWSSQYFFEDAVREVEERMVSLEHSAPHVEPVAWRLKSDAFDYAITSYDKEQADAYINNGWILVDALYTTPPTQQSCSQRPSRSDMTWIGLTEQEIDEAIENNQRLEGFRKVGFAYDLEAILKEKNTHE